MSVANSLNIMILNDFSEVERAMSEIEQSAGSADKEMGIIQESLDYKINALKETWTGIFQNLIDRGVIGDIIDILTKLSEVIEKITSNTTGVQMLFSTIVASIIQIKTKGNFDWIEQFKELGSSIIEFMSIREESSSEIIDQVETETESIIDETTALVQEEVQAAATSKAMALLKSVTNALITSAIIFGVTKLVQLFDDWVHRTEKLADAAKKAKDEISNINKSFNTLKNTTNEIKRRYADLAQGVVNLGTAFQSQGSLSTNEYKEFLDLSNQLSELYPDLTKGYTTNGDAILSLSGSVETIVNSLDDLIDREKELNNISIWNKSNEIWDGLKVAQQENEKVIKNLEDSSFRLQRAYNNIRYDYESSISRTTTIGQEDLANLSVIFDRAGLKLSEYLHHYNQNEIVYNFGSLTEEERNQIEKAFEELRASYTSEIDATRDSLIGEFSEVHDIIFSWLETQSTSYKEIGEMYGEEGQKIVQELLNNINPDQLESHIKNDNKNQFVAWIQNEYLVPLTNASAEIHDKIIDLFTGSVKPEDIDKAYQDIINYLIEHYGSDKEIVVYWKMKYEEYRGEKDNLLSHLLGKNYQWDTKENLDKYNEFVNSLTSEDWNKLLNMHIDLKGLPHAEDKINYFKQLLEGIPEEVTVEMRTAVDAVDTFSQTKQALSSLSELYEQVVTDKEFANPEYINNVESAFGGIAEESPIVAQALTNFENILLEFPGDSEKAQDAINKLVSAYIDESDILKDLTEDNKEWKIATLEAMGITNAEDVVISRLTATTKASIQVLSNLRDELTKFHEVERQEDKNPLYDDKGFRKYSEDYVNALNELKEKTKDALTVYDEEGQKYYKHLQLSDTFVKTHLADIQAMAEGDEEALERVKLAASKEVLGESLIEVTPTLSTEELESQVNTLADYFQNIPDMEIGASLNEGEFINGLNNILASGKYTADQVAEFMKSMGYDVQIEQAKSKVIVPNPNGSHMTSVYGGSNAGSTVSWDMKEMEMSFPSVKIITKKGSYGGGVQADMANYKPPKENNSGGGGSGDETDKLAEQMDVLKWLYDNDVIDYKHYLDQKKILLDRALAEGLIDQKRYFEEIHSWLREMLDLYNSAISYITKQLDKEIDKLEEERDERIKSIEEERDAELKAIDEEIEAQEKKIKLKQKEIDELQKANEARKQAIDLQKAEYELQRSMHQRTNLVEILCQAS